MKIKKKRKGILLKRIIDVVISGIGLIILFPIFVVIGVLIKLDSKGPVFFIQKRIGKDGKSFKIIKFRTMITGKEEETKKMEINKDNPYVTSFGKLLRRTGFDELSQLINVLKGDMSLVGPRPTLLYQVKNYNEFEKKRLIIKPGITSWGLINGRNSLTWSETIKLDIWYINNWSFWLDIKILIKTIIVVAKAEGLYPVKGKRE
jgi:lipopolysaccharide/colanic/teichoic acid biosynthesis glycosyltransferase